MQNFLKFFLSVNIIRPLCFILRKGVTFQDGHEFDAGDVKFTYEAIMNPKNLSPRTPDFEPIKTVEIIDPYTVKIIYKRLYSPAINAWTMGILPEHLLNDASHWLSEKQERGLSEEAQETFGMRDSQFNRHPIGSGRFQFVEWQGMNLFISNVSNNIGRDLHNIMTIICELFQNSSRKKWSLKPEPSIFMGRNRIK